MRRRPKSYISVFDILFLYSTTQQHATFFFCTSWDIPNSRPPEEPVREFETKGVLVADLIPAAYRTSLRELIGPSNDLVVH